MQLDEHFSGPAGGKLHHLLYRVNRTRAETRVHNVICCRPPYDKLEKMPWEYAITHCRPNLDRVLAEPHRVVVTLGAVPTRQMLQLGGNLKDFHGTVTWVNFPSHPAGGFWVVPTFHPSHLLRGAHNLTGTVLFDLTRAFDVADNGWTPDVPTLHLDPPPAFLEAWADEYLAAVEQDPLSVWLSVDVETPDKERKQDEGELKSADRSMEILRVNLSFRTDEGLTVPFVGPYITIIGRILASLGPKWFWNKNYDLRRLWAVYGVAGLRGPLLDGMDAWHALHSDVPKGLGFVAPFYSRWGPWKHLSKTKPVFYAAGDGVQNQRCCFGVAADLQSQGMWDVFWRHMHEVDRLATSLSCQVGLKIDAVKVEEMRVDLAAKSAGFAAQIQALVPEEIKPLHPKGGWKHPPASPPDGRLMFTRLVKQEVHVCVTCGAEEVSVKHRCKDEAGKPDKAARPQVLKQQLEVSRTFVRLDFNPGSWQQVLAYIKHCGHKPGRERGRETTNRETIERLAEGKPRSLKDEKARELYRILMDFRDVKKILGNYVEGTLRRLAESKDGRVHPVVTNNPSTMRTAYNSPNLQNVVADKRGKESLAAGFRKCIVAEVDDGQAG